MGFSKEPNINISRVNKTTAVYLFLGGLFVAFLVLCNLIANKFISINLFFRSSPFIISCGILPYPLTFLITDLLSEFYGRRKTTLVIFTGFVASILIILFLFLANSIPAVNFSPVNDSSFNQVFGNSWRVISASMTAYLMAQLVDVNLYEFWRKLTKGKYLWIRNNGSTIISQLVDTVLVVLVLFIGVLPGQEMLNLITDGWLFKIFCALIDTPIIYGCVYLLRKYFNLQKGEVVSF